jgi:hypothetical protein
MRELEARGAAGRAAGDGLIRHSGMLRQNEGWAKPTSRANARPMTGSACPPAASSKKVGTAKAPFPTLHTASSAFADDDDQHAWRHHRPAMTVIPQNFSTQGRNSSSQVQALRGCCSTFQ